MTPRANCISHPSLKQEEIQLRAYYSLHAVRSGQEPNARTESTVAERYPGIHQNLYPSSFVGIWKVSYGFFGQYKSQQKGKQHCLQLSHHRLQCHWRHRPSCFREATSRNLYSIEDATICLDETVPLISASSYNSITIDRSFNISRYTTSWGSGQRDEQLSEKFRCDMQEERKGWKDHLGYQGWKDRCL